MDDNLGCDVLITQEINRLTASFNKCGHVTHRELLKLLNLVTMLNDCKGGGNYNTLVQKTYDTPGEVIFQVGSFHSFSLNVMKGAMEYGGVNFTAGTTRNAEFSTTNQTVIKFKVNPGSSVFMEYLI